MGLGLLLCNQVALFEFCLDRIQIKTKFFLPELLLIDERLISTRLFEYPMSLELETQTYVLEESQCKDSRDLEDILTLVKAIFMVYYRHLFADRYNTILVTKMHSILMALICIISY